MCGPVAAAIALPRRRGRFFSQAAYNLGRITTYGLLGGAAGAAGSMLGVAARTEALQRAVEIAAGLLVAAAGLSAGGWLPALPGAAPEGILRRAGSRLKVFFETGGPGAYYPLGLVLGLLPCGPVYTVLLAAAREGMESAGGPTGFARGMAAALSFGLGSVPALLLAAEAAARLGGPARARLGRAAAAILVALGVFYAARGAWR